MFEFFSVTKWRTGYYVYKRASLVEHSCAPNCVWSISNFPEFKIRLRAAYPLEKGQKLTINHLEFHAEGPKGTVERRMGIFLRFGFTCMCERCVDPTELGTYASAFVCQKCRRPDENKVVAEDMGYLLPANQSALGITEDIPWRCNACQYAIQLNRLYPKIEELTQAIEANDGKAIDYNPVAAGEIANILIDKYKGIFLHPNHWLIQRAVLILLDIGYQDLCSRPRNIESDISKVMANCEYMLKNMEKAHPGLSPLKG